MSSVCKHGVYRGDGEGCGRCANERQRRIDQLEHAQAKRAVEAKAIIERCGNPSGKGDKYTWPDGELSHCTGAVGDDNCYAEPGGAICAPCIEALVKLLEGK